MSTLDTPTSGPVSRSGSQSATETSDQIGSWLDRLVRLTRLPSAEASELREELDAHLRDRVRDLMLVGHDEPDAIHRSISELGDLAQLAQRYREASRTPRRRLFMNLAVIAVAGSALGLSTLALQSGQPESPSAALAPGEYHLVPRAVTTPEGTGISLEIVPRLAGDGEPVPVLADIPVVGRLFGGESPGAVSLTQSAEDLQLRVVLLMLAEP
ncbi:MAG: permease prefix domain 1-containing protein, partial [Phycisphaerales bacterium JB041]